MLVVSERSSGQETTFDTQASFGEICMLDGLQNDQETSTLYRNVYRTLVVSE